MEFLMAPGTTKKPPKALKAKWFHILLSLADQDLHGTAIMEDVLRRTQGAIRLWPGALYGALEDMSEKGIIQEVPPPAGAPTEGGKRRFYAITQSGRETLAAEVTRFEELVLEARAKGVGEAPIGT
jgi:DNA-binding PadR family transcriptional regulator